MHSLFIKAKIYILLKLMKTKFIYFSVNSLQTALHGIVKAVT